MDFFSDDIRRNPYPLFSQLRSISPVLREPQSGLWMVFDYEGAKRTLSEHETFSSRSSYEWLVFIDPPRHTKLRALISRGFTPRSVANLESRIRQISGELLDEKIERGEMDLAADFAAVLPMQVIAEMLGIPGADLAQFTRWSDVILNMSHTVPGTEGAAKALSDYAAVTGEMNEYLAELLDQRKVAPHDDLLTRLAGAEVDGERLTQEEILGFFQLLLVAGTETTTNLINNAILCFIEHPDQLARLRAEPELLPAAIEEVLRYRSPLQWIFRITRHDVEMHGQAIPAKSLVLPMIGSANRDPQHFRDADRFDIARDPNPHIAFGQGVHFCLGAALSRLEARIALCDLLERLKDFKLASGEPWKPRAALHVHGPARLPIRFEPGRRRAASA
jgi:cytochrome P450